MVIMVSKVQKFKKSESRLISLHLTVIFPVGMKLLVVSSQSDLQPTRTYTNLQFLISIGPRLIFHFFPYIFFFLSQVLEV
jgi:hypothetical protein